MSLFARLLLASSCTLGAACGDSSAGRWDAAADDATSRDTSFVDAPPNNAPADALPMLSVSDMIDKSCEDGTCKASAIVAYWKDQWNTYATQRTVTFVETSPTVFGLRITDESDATASLEFAAGVPVTLTLRNPGDTRSTQPHFLTAPLFYRSVAFRKADSESAEYKGVGFDSFGVNWTQATDRELKLFFVPMASGAFDAYCESDVPNGGAYADIVKAVVTPDLDSSEGHAGKGMKDTITIVGDLGVTLDPELVAGRVAALDGDSRRDSKHAVWQSGVHEQTLTLHENSPTSYEFRPATLTLTTGIGHAIAITNPNDNISKHYLTTPEFFVTTVMRHATDLDAEVRASYLRGVEVKQGGTAHLFVVPTTAGTYSSYCEIGVEDKPNGSPDFDTGHAGLGMAGTVMVTDP